jgi:hypothetical protein
VNWASLQELDHEDKHCLLVHDVRAWPFSVGEEEKKIGKKDAWERLQNSFE